MQKEYYSFTGPQTTPVVKRTNKLDAAPRVFIETTGFSTLCEVQDFIQANGLNSIGNSFVREYYQKEVTGTV